MSFYSQLLQTGLSAGLPMISTDTCARIAAIVHSFNHEGMLGDKFAADCAYLQKRFGVDGATTPDKEFAKLVCRYVREVEEYGKKHKAPVPWAVELCKERYGFDLFW